MRLNCPFQQDIYRTAARLREILGARVLRRKDCAQPPKPNGYRSYHMIPSLPLRFLSVQRLIVREREKCADEIPSTDLSLETIGSLIEALR